MTDICLACRQALLGHGDTVFLFATDNNFHHSDYILQQILSFVCFRKGKISFSEKINGLPPTNQEFSRIKVIGNTLNHNFNFYGFSKQYLTLSFRNIVDKRRVRLKLSIC